MRFTLATILFAAPALPALAHVLDADAGIAARLGHQLSGAHHWPMLILAAFAISVCAGLLRHRRAATRIRRK